jgi:pimeloyl-[acyl-carrier protein] methyl ester esterase
MSTRATGIVFLPGFDGVAQLRSPFVEALAERYPARAIGYPNHTLGTLNGYARFVAAQVQPQARPLVVAESFSGLVAARWAASDPHVAGLVLCGAFARSPVPLAALGARLPSLTRFLGANFLNPVGFLPSDPARRRWSKGLADAIGGLEPEVVAERLRIIADEDVSRELSALRVPIVVVEFAQDLVVGRSATADLARCCAGASVVTLEGPHFALETRPRECAAALQPYLGAFLDSRAAQGCSTSPREARAGASSSRRWACASSPCSSARAPAAIRTPTNRCSRASSPTPTCGA